MKWTTKELAELIGQRVHVPVGDMQVAVTVKDAAHKYGRLRLHVSPCEGKGSSWVEKVELSKGGKDEAR